MAITNAPPLRISRNELARFLKDHQQIKTFENLLAIVEQIAPTSVEEAAISAENATSIGHALEAEIQDIKDSNIEAATASAISNLLLNEIQSIKNEIGAQIQIALNNIQELCVVQNIENTQNECLCCETALSLAKSMAVEIQNIKNELGISQNRSEPTMVSAGTNISISSTSGGVIVSTTSTINAILVDNTTRLISSSATLTNNAGAAAGTLGNAPTAGNPTKWVSINDNGTTRYIPTWT